MDQSTMQLKTIEYQLNQHLKKRNQKHEKITIDTNQKNAYNQECFDAHINNEINGSLKKKWNSLPMYFKWRCIQSYLDKNNITDIGKITAIKASLANNTLNGIVYDAVSQEVTSIVI